MDKNTIIGLGLIGAILVVFTFYNKPSEEEMRAKRAEQEQIVQNLKDAGEKSKDLSITETVEEDVITDSLTLLNAENNEVLDSLGNVVATEVKTPVKKSTANVAQEETYQLENSQLDIVLTNKGGGIKSVHLKNHQTYDDYIKNKESEEITPLLLFEEDKASNNVNFKIGNTIYNSDELDFKVTKQTDSYISFVAKVEGNKSIEQVYTIAPDEYHVNYEIKLNGFGQDVKAETVYLDFNVDLLKSERLLSEQRNTSTVFYHEKGGSYKYLSETKDDEYISKVDMDWVAFKQSYFSSILMPENGFKKEGTILGVSGYKESDSKDSTHVKRYSASLNLGMANTENGVVEMKWFFGPNDYDLLAAYNNKTENLLNYGWGLFRWINIYAIQPLFVWLAAFGMNLGIAILILTVVIKLVLTPIQWKMFASSMKMRILKPEIDEINAKYPNKDQATEKQMEIMTLYRESGASPLAGCVPMLIQMPILFAVFRFFPSTFALRQKSFLWAEDLSSYDSIYDFGFNIPMYGDHISLFTLLMAGTTLFYTILNSGNQMEQASQPGMPNMKIIMYFFPIMMIFFFNNFSSGLSYYYFISTLMSILTMLLIKHFFVDEDKLKLKMAERKEANKANGAKKGKSKFQERLEEMQRIQQEKAKNKK